MKHWRRWCELRICCAKREGLPRRVTTAMVTGEWVWLNEEAGEAVLRRSRLAKRHLNPASKQESVGMLR